MFEDSTFKSTGRIHTRSRRWMIVTLAINGSILLALILIPLVFPEALPQHFLPSLMVVPTAPTPEQPKPVRQPTQAFHGNSELMERQLVAPRQIPIDIVMVKGPEVVPGGSVQGMDLGQACRVETVMYSTDAGL